MNAVLATPLRPLHLVPALRPEWSPALRGSLEGIEVTFLDVEEIELDQALGQLECNPAAEWRALRASGTTPQSE